MFLFLITQATSKQPPAQQVPPQTASQPPQTVLQPPETVLQSQPPVLQHPQTVLSPHQSGLQQPLQAAPQPLQTMPHPSLPGDSTALPTFVQFTMPPNVFPSPAQPPIQHAVPPSLTSAHSSTMSLLNALNDDKLGLILPVLVRMEHKIDQLMAMMGSGQGTGNHFNAAMMGSQSNATMIGSQSNATMMGSQSNATMMGNQSNTTMMGSQPNATITGSQSNARTGAQKNTSSQATTTTQNASEPRPSTSSMASMQANARQTVAELFDSPIEIEEDDTEPEDQPSAEKTFNATKSLPGMTARQRIQLEMAKITEKTLPDDLNFPISREDLITLQARSTSTMNFAVRLLRELFSRDELIGRNISGVRGKERVDPARIEVIKEIVFKIYRTSPSDRELLWRYCRKAMDSFLRKMQRPIEVVKDQYDRPSFDVNTSEALPAVEDKK